MRACLFEEFDFSSSNLPLADVFTAHPAIKLIAKNVLKINPMNFCERGQTVMGMIKI
jgi:hypothetical protein